MSISLSSSALFCSILIKWKSDSCSEWSTFFRAQTISRRTIPKQYMSIFSVIRPGGSLHKFWSNISRGSSHWNLYLSRSVIDDLR
jgi:hypothetical protein